MNISATFFPSPRLSDVLRALMAAVAGWGGRGVLGGAVTVLLYARLSGLCGRMERMVARFEAGRLWRRRAGGGETAGRVAPARGKRVLPGRFGWLVRVAGYQAAGFGGQLRAVLETPEMTALLAASPQAVRMLRPVCRMLAVPVSVLRPHLAGAATAVAPVLVTAPAAKPVRRKPEPVDWGRSPLPRGVLAAARRRGFGKVG